MTASLHVRGLVDRLRAHPLLLPVAEHHREVVADLFGAPLHTQFRLQTDGTRTDPSAGGSVAVAHS